MTLTFAAWWTIQLGRMINQHLAPGAGWMTWLFTPLIAVIGGILGFAIGVSCAVVGYVYWPL